jgi:hypothetical protein
MVKEFGGEIYSMRMRDFKTKFLLFISFSSCAG